MFLQVVHYIGHLGSRQTDFFQFFIMRKNFPRRTVQHFFSPVHHNDPLYIPGDIFHTVGHKDHRHPGLSVEMFDLIQYLIPAFRIQAGCWLVQHQHFRMHSQNACYSHAAFLAEVSTSASEQLLTKFEAAAKSLEQFPTRCPWLRGDYIPQNKYRCLLFSERYLLIYQIQDRIVYVDYIVDCRQNYEWLIR